MNLYANAFQEGTVKHREYLAGLGRVSRQNRFKQGMDRYFSKYDISNFSIKENGKVLAIFQPHRYSRLKNHFDEFCSSFNDADKVILLQVYSAGEKKLLNGEFNKELEPWDPMGSLA